MQETSDDVQAAAAVQPDPSMRVCAAVIVVLIVAGALVPGSTKHWLLDGFPGAWHVDKLGHALGFAAMGFTCVRSRFPRVRAWHVLAFALALGVFTELAQRFVPGRTSKLTDVLIDLLGACAGVYVALMLSGTRAGRP